MAVSDSETKTTDENRELCSDVKKCNQTKSNVNVYCFCLVCFHAIRHTRWPIHFSFLDHSLIVFIAAYSMWFYLSLKEYRISTRRKKSSKKNKHFSIYWNSYFGWIYFHENVKINLSKFSDVIFVRPVRHLKTIIIYDCFSHAMNVWISFERMKKKRKKKNDRELSLVEWEMRTFVSAKCSVRVLFPPQNSAWTKREANIIGRFFSSFSSVQTAKKTNINRDSVPKQIANREQKNCNVESNLRVGIDRKTSAL